MWVAAACLDVDKSVLTWCYYVCNCCYKIPYIQSIYKGAPLDSCTNTPAVLNIIQKYKILANIFASFLEHDEVVNSYCCSLINPSHLHLPLTFQNNISWYTCRLSDTRLMTKWIPAWEESKCSYYKCCVVHRKGCTHQRTPLSRVVYYCRQFPFNCQY